MTIHEKDLRDPELGRALRETLDPGEVPEAWIADVRRVMPSRIDAPLPGAEPVWRPILPHILAGTALLAFAIAWFARPEVRRSCAGLVAGLESFGRVLLSFLPEHEATISPEIVGGLVLIALIMEASRGFREVRRWVE